MKEKATSVTGYCVNCDTTVDVEAEDCRFDYEYGSCRGVAGELVPVCAECGEYLDIYTLEYDYDPPSWAEDDYRERHFF